MAKARVADTSRGPLLRPEAKEATKLWVQLARAMRQRGMSYQAIGDQLFPQRTPLSRYRKVYKALNREQIRQWDVASDKRNRASRTKQDLAYRRSIAPPCSCCGRPLSRPPKGNPPKCRECVRAGIGYQPPPWWLEMLRDWNHGEDTAIITERYGRSTAYIHNIVCRLKQKGFPVIPRAVHDSELLEA